MEIDYKQMKFIHPTLITVVDDFEKEFGSKRVTSLHRMHDPGIHGTLPLRAIDIGEQNGAVGVILENWLNTRWVYDPDRPTLNVALYHDVGRGKHLHVQVHKNTKRR